MASQGDFKHIATVLIPELLEAFNEWGREYRQERDLGIRGEFVGLYRKTRKLKTLFWDQGDGDPPPEAAGWREPPRKIIQEVVAHGLLMLVDWDKEHPEEVPVNLGGEGQHPVTPGEAMQILKELNDNKLKSNEDGCPSCGSLSPNMHPAVGGGGEVTSMCKHPFHYPDRDADAPNYEADSEEESSDYSNCGRCNPGIGHTYGHLCAAKRKQSMVMPENDGPFLEDDGEESEEDYCPTCASHMKAARLVISHGTRCGDEWHQDEEEDNPDAYHTIKTCPDPENHRYHGKVTIADAESHRSWH